VSLVDCASSDVMAPKGHPISGLVLQVLPCGSPVMTAPFAVTTRPPPRRLPLLAANRSSVDTCETQLRRCSSWSISSEGDRRLPSDRGDPAQHLRQKKHLRKAPTPVAAATFFSKNLKVLHQNAFVLSFHLTDFSLISCNVHAE
jgi:hypothetical protein